MLCGLRKDFGQEVESRSVGLLQSLFGTRGYHYYVPYNGDNNRKNQGEVELKEWEGSDKKKKRGVSNKKQ